MTEPIQLSVEEELKIRIFSETVKSMSEIETKEALSDMYKNLIFQEIHYKQEVQKRWFPSNAIKHG